MDALEFLRRDHDEVRSLFKKLATADNGREALADAIALALTAHSHIEEGLFYPILEEQKDQQLIAMVDKSLKDHQEIKSLLKDTSGLHHDSLQLALALMELERHVENHFGEEETQIFPRVRQAIGTGELERIGEALEVEKKNYPAGGVHIPGMA